MDLVSSIRQKQVKSENDVFKHFLKIFFHKDAILTF